MFFYFCQVCWCRVLVQGLLYKVDYEEQSKAIKRHILGLAQLRAILAMIWLDSTWQTWPCTSPGREGGPRKADLEKTDFFWLFLLDAIKDAVKKVCHRRFSLPPHDCLWALWIRWGDPSAPAVSLLLLRDDGTDFLEMMSTWLCDAFSCSPTQRRSMEGKPPWLRS